jgi:hypothetical protein
LPQEAEIATPPCALPALPPVGAGLPAIRIAAKAAPTDGLHCGQGRSYMDKEPQSPIFMSLFFWTSGYEI